MESKPVKLAADIQWAFFDRVNEMTGRYQCDLTNLSEQAVAKLSELGIECLRREDKPEKGWFITVKSSYAIEPVDKENNKIKDTVGNGSKAVALIKPYEWTWKNKKGVSASLMKITVTDLVKYNPDNGVEEESTDDDDIL